MIKKRKQKLLSIIPFGITLLFFYWSKLFFASLFLLVVIDLLITKIFIAFLKKRVSIFTIKILKLFFFILLPIALTIFVRTFFLDIYFVPSSSMEKTLFPNDYVIVDKVTYGSKVPKRLQDIPVIGKFFKTNEKLSKFDLYRQLKGFDEFKRDDIVVFKSTIDSDAFLIKRIIGTPGDTIEIVNSKVKINNNILNEKEYYCYDFVDSTETGISLIRTLSNFEFNSLSDNERLSLRKDIQKKALKNSTLFPADVSKEKKWTRDNYGEVIIPKKGMTIVLSANNFSFYKKILHQFEDRRIAIPENQSLQYTFQNNYYFMLGDNRHQSSDSRYFGFIPECFIQGKMIKVFSKSRILN